MTHPCLILVNMTLFMTCSVPHHVDLVLGVDDILNEVDPIGIGADSPDPHEYSPEIPGLVQMVVENDITESALHRVFEQMFAEGMVPNELKTQTILRGLMELRDKWVWWQRPKENQGDD